MMKKILLFICCVITISFINAQTSDFDGTDGLSLTLSGGSTTSGSGGVSSPAGGEFGNPNNGYVESGGTATITTGTVTTSSTSSFSFDLASLSGTSGNGADGGDEVLVEISLNGGTTFTTVSTINGNNNARWTYAGGGGTASNAFSSPATYAPTGGGVRTTDGITFVEVTDIPVGDIVVRITLDNNSGNEYWAIDNLTLTSNAPDPCGVTLGTETYVCDSNNAGSGNDLVTVNIPYAGLDAGITSVSIIDDGSSVTNDGDNPAATADGTISFLSEEGNTWSVTLNGGDCDGRTISGTVPATECDPPSMDGGEIVFQMINPCGNDGGNEFVVITLEGNTNIDDIAIGSVNHAADNDWNFFWNTVNSNVGVSDLNPSTTTVSNASNDLDFLDPNIPADATMINTQIASLNGATGSNNNVFQAVPASGDIPGGSTVVLFLGAGNGGFDDIANNMAFDDPSYDNANLYAIFGTGSGGGFFSNSDQRTQFLSINGNVTNFTYNPAGSGEAAYVDANNTFVSNGDCVPPLSTLILPVELTTITAQLVGENQIALIEWETATETNNDYFEIQHSVNGLDWTEIGNVAGSGTTLEPQSYSFSHYNAINGNNYYRVKQVDFDGTFAFSEIVVLNAEFEQNLSIAAMNRSALTVLSTKDGVANYQIFNSVGVLITENEFSAIRGSQSLYYPNGDLAAGFYIVRIVVDNEVIVKKFIVR